MTKRQRAAWVNRSKRRICRGISLEVWTDWVAPSYYDADEQRFATKLIERFKAAIRRVR